MTDEIQEVGRLAMRVEGDNWNAYYALTNTMEGAIYLGSIRMGAVTDNRDRKRAFMKMMEDIVADIIEEKFGERPSFGEPDKAPEHERSGSA